MDINFRLEQPADYRAVEELTREAFWPFWEPDQTICYEHLLVRLLRSAPSFVPELNFVAELDGKIVGHIIYTKSRVVDDEGYEHETLTFGPLSVLPEFQSKGIGQALMRHSFEEARRLGYRAVLIFGHPDYYPRAGFRRAAEFGITSGDGVSRDAFMAYPLYYGALDGVHGRYFIDPVYEQLSDEAALEFDKQFPPKEPFIRTPISVLLDRLEPDARAALAGTGCLSLEMMTSKSEREISSLPGMDADSVETIRSVLREHGVRWGAPADMRVYEPDIIPEPEKMSEFFDARADIYDNHMLGDTKLGEFYEAIAPCFDEPIVRLLDLGCGTGLELEGLFERFPDMEVTGIDLSAEMLKKLSEKYPGKNLRLIHGSFFDKDFGGPYDAVLSTYSLHHFTEERKLEIYRKIHAAIKPGGLFVFGDYTVAAIGQQQEFLDIYHNLHREREIPEDEFYHIDIPFTAETEIRLMKAAGFASPQLVRHWDNASIITAVKL